MLLHGSIAGLDREADCEILARRIVLSTGAGQKSLPRYDYTDCSIITAPPDLPDGQYLVRFDDFSFKATRKRGFWVSSGPAQRSPEQPPPDE